MGLACALPLGWIAAQIIVEPAVWGEARLDAFRARLLGRTVLYNAAAAVGATLLALPAAMTLGRGRGRVAAALWLALPIPLLLPSIVLAYGWSQFLRLLDVRLMPAGAGDAIRCIWTLATWLWPIPAAAMGLALRRMERQVQEQALLDGVLWRMTLRHLLAPAIAAACVVCIVAMQEFAVYEPTGISVIATEVRMVFETGAFSAPDNPITQPIQGIPTDAAGGLTGQSARAAAAVAASLPLLATIALLVAAAALCARRLSAAERIDAGDWSRTLDARSAVIAAAWIIVLITLLMPIAAMALSLVRPQGIAAIWREFSPQLIGSIVIGVTTALVAGGLALLASALRTRGLLLLGLITFLVGGQLLAIALIRLYNRPAPGWVGELLMLVYNGLPIIVMALLGRFAWIALLGARMTWTRPWQELRDLAALDGAGPMRSALHVIWPLAWPILAAAGLVVMVLSLSEVPATVLISPQRPQPLIPMLMTWVHMLRYDSMIEGSLLLSALVMSLGLVAVLLGWVGLKWISRFPRLAILSISLMLLGCSDACAPSDIWLNTGKGPGQVVYPRAITYSPLHDSFFVVDRMARIQQISSRGELLSEWQMPLWEHGKPVGVSVGPDGDVYVPDTHYHRVMVYTPDGRPVREWGSMGYEPGQFIYPTDIAFDEAGNVYVAEYGDNDRIQVFDREGNFIRQFGTFGTGDGEFRRPQSLLIHEELVYVVDSCNHRIVVFRTDGSFVRNMGRVGSELGEFRYPYGIALDSRGRLVVAEFGNNRVQQLDRQTGHGLAAWGSAGRAPGQLAYPWAVAVDKRNRVVAVDSGNNRLQVFEF